ncbi:MAG: VOC family protein [Lachnospiraceae bacterium]
MFQPDHYAISVGDVEKSISFYEKLEFEVIKDFSAEDGSVRIVQMENGSFILEMFCYPDSEKLPDFVNTLGEDLKVKGAKHLGLQVEDVKAAAVHVKEIGLVDEIPVVSEGRLGRPYFFIKDPDGIFVEIISAR